jgi:PH (Pleckstrin Homology) domain-containing protein
MSGSAIILLIMVLAAAGGVAALYMHRRSLHPDRQRQEPEFYEDEEILHKTGRHWVVLVQRGFIVALAAGLTAGLAFYWAIGGSFIESDVGDVGRFDLTNIILIVLIGVLILLWQRQARRPVKGKQPSRFAWLPDLPFILGVGVLALLVFFRFRGGRVFYINPLEARGDEPLSLVLAGIALMLTGALVYIMIDWANDYLILTPTRVIYDDQQLLIRHFQQELLIENIQQVNVRADSYLAYGLGQIGYAMGIFGSWFGLRERPKPPAQASFATIVIGSFSPQNITFARAMYPYAMQSAIQAKINQRNKAKAPELLQRLIEDQVYKNQVPKQPGPAVHVHVEERHGSRLIHWLFHTNPERDGDTLTWRPFWLFMVLAILRPFGTFALATIGLALLTQLGLLPGVWAFLIWLPITLFCLGWLIWIREEHVNDKYVLNLQTIIDVDKKPFGPESSRRAPLTAIQNIEFDVSFLESILGYGDVIIETAGGGGKLTFHHVPDPRGVQATINDYLTYAKKRDQERPFKEALDLLKEYHTIQVGRGELVDNANPKLAAVVSDKVSAYMDETVPAQVANEVATQLPQHIHRQVSGAVRQELWRAMLRRRRPRRGA